MAVKSGVILCAIAYLIGVIPRAYADAIMTGANLSGEARAIMDRERPDSTFETQSPPPEPDYASAAAWAALPDKADNADLAPPNTKYPESQGAARADVFFIHPTASAAARNNWNIPIDDPMVAQTVDNVMGFCASAFNAAAKVYAPRYREANLYAFFDDKTDSGLKAVELAYRDVERAFLHYMQFYNRGRPFILAGHSQGSMHGSRLLQEHIIGTPLMDRMIAAYLIGGTIPKDLPGIPSSRSATDTGVLIGWNTYTKDGDPGIFTDGLIGWIGHSYVKMGGKPLLRTNPLSWELNGPEIGPSRNPGSLPFLEGEDGTPSLIPGVCGADASGRALIINKPGVPGFEISEAGDLPILNARYGDYHSFDYTLFYESIRKNAIDRVRAFFKTDLRK